MLTPQRLQPECGQSRHCDGRPRTLLLARNHPVSAEATYWKHLGLYAYRSAALLRFATLQPSSLEQTERLEQLRLLENGIGLYVEAADFDTVGVDTEEDLERVATMLSLQQP